MSEKIIVGPTQRKILGLMHAEPDLTHSISELAEKIGMKPSILRKAIDRLYKRGLVLRSPTEHVHSYVRVDSSTRRRQ